MANSYYTKESLNNFLDWENNILKANNLRKYGANALLTSNMGLVMNGFTTPCNKCGHVVKAEFGDFSKPLDEKFVECPMGCGTGEDGHGVWASAINMILN